MSFTSICIIRCLQTKAKHGIKSALSSTSSGTSNTLYSHIAQIGDPVLRKKSQPVDIDRLSSAEIQNLIKQMKIVLGKYDATGISAVQLGIPLRMFALQVTKQQMGGISDDMIESTNMDILPFRIFINPEMKLIGNDTIVRKEGCTSVNGYEADVSRHKCVHVTGYDENGKSVSWEAKNWNARMVQHEMDHLDGILFTDKMCSPESLSFKYWKTVNAKNGEFRLHFGGLPGWKQYYYVLPILVSIPLYIAYDIWLYS